MEQLTPEQRARLKAARESKGLTLSDVATQAGVSVHDLEVLELGFINSSLFYRIVVGVYKVQMYEIFNGVYTYQTPQEWMDAYLNEEVSEGTLSDGLKTDIVDARRQVQEYQKANSQ